MGDKILSVNGVSLRGKKLAEAMPKVRRGDEEARRRGGGGTERDEAGVERHVWSGLCLVR